MKTLTVLLKNDVIKQTYNRLIILVNIERYKYLFFMLTLYHEQVTNVHFYV